MKGNTLTEFINDLITSGGPEKEFKFRNKIYFLESVYDPEKQMIEMYMFETTDNDKSAISFWGHNFQECVDQFEEAKLFDGKTIYEAESEIEVLYG